MLWADFATVRKNDYTIVFGPTDCDGNASLTLEGILRQANSQLRLALMDFEPIEGAFSGDVVVSVMNADDLARAIDAFGLFGSVGWYPQHYREHLEAGVGALSRIRFRDLRLALSIVPGDDMV